MAEEKAREAIVPQVGTVAPDFVADVRAATPSQAAELVVPRDTATEIAVLKGVAAHYVMRADEPRPSLERERALEPAPDPEDGAFRVPSPQA